MDALSSDSVTILILILIHLPDNGGLREPYESRVLSQCQAMGAPGRHARAGGVAVGVAVGNSGCDSACGCPQCGSLSVLCVDV